MANLKSSLRMICGRHHVQLYVSLVIVYPFHLNVCKSPPLNSDLHDTVMDNISQEAETFVGGSGVPITTEQK
jgi:hypothetical protein